MKRDKRIAFKEKHYQGRRMGSGKQGEIEGCKRKFY